MIVIIDDLKIYDMLIRSTKFDKKLFQDKLMNTRMLRIAISTVFFCIMLPTFMIHSMQRQQSLAKAEIEKLDVSKLPLGSLDAMDALYTPRTVLAICDHIATKFGGKGQFQQVQRNTSVRGPKGLTQDEIEKLDVSKLPLSNLDAMDALYTPRTVDAICVYIKAKSNGKILQSQQVQQDNTPKPVAAMQGPKTLTQDEIKTLDLSKLPLTDGKKMEALFTPRTLDAICDYFEGKTAGKETQSQQIDKTVSAKPAPAKAEQGKEPQKESHTNLIQMLGQIILS